MSSRFIDEVTQVIGLSVYHSEVQEHFGIVRGSGTVQHDTGTSLDRGQRRSQFMAHHGEELAA